MLITPRALARFLTFLEQRSSETYPEEPSGIHDTATARAIETLLANFSLPATARVLDVGCGQGVALKPFTELGLSPIGITLNPTDVQVCCTLGFDVRLMDQSFLDFNEGSFDLIWARHVVEHSFMPLYTLAEFRRVLRTNGILYLEVPAPGTLDHEKNPNHYSVMGKTMWLSLLERNGFALAGETDYFIKTVENRSDEYWGFFAIARHPGYFS